MQKSTKQVAVVAGVAAGLVALAAGSYFLLGPNGKKNRKEIKGWTLKMKGDVLEKLEKLQDVTPEVYNQIIDDVTLKYGKLKNIQAAELAEIASDLKKHWKAISKDMKAGGATAKKKVTKAKVVVKKAVAKKQATASKVAKKVAETV